MWKTKGRKIFIYKIRNLVNGKVYIGQSLNVDRRFNTHKVIAIRGKKSALANAIRKYGIDNFVVEVLGKCSTRESANRYETRCIKLENKKRKTYNMTLGGEGFIGGRHSKESREKLSKATLGRIVTWGDKISAGKLGKKRPPLSKDWRKRISEGMKGIKRSKKTRMKIRKALKGIPLSEERKRRVSEGVSKAMYKWWKDRRRNN